MKTMKQWNESGQMLNEFLKIGDLVDEEMKMYFLEVLPPRTWTNRVIQIGEPCDSDSQGHLTYSTLIRDAEGWKYVGEKSRPIHWPENKKEADFIKDHFIVCHCK